MQENSNIRRCSKCDVVLTSNNSYTNQTAYLCKRCKGLYQKSWRMKRKAEEFSLLIKEASPNSNTANIEVYHDADHQKSGIIRLFYSGTKKDTCRICGNSANADEIISNDGTCYPCSIKWGKLNLNSNKIRDVNIGYCEYGRDYKKALKKFKEKFPGKEKIIIDGEEYLIEHYFFINQRELVPALRGKKKLHKGQQFIYSLRFD